MNRTALTTFVTGLLAPLLASPNPKTDLTGAWEMDSTRSESPQYGDSKQPVTLIIKQTEFDVTVETRKDGQVETIVYRMDGTETEKRPAPDNGPYRWSARWDGSKLITQTQRNINHTAVTVTEVLSLSANRKEMTVNRTLTVQHGYSWDKAKNYSSAKDVFVKAR